MTHMKDSMMHNFHSHRGRHGGHHDGHGPHGRFGAADGFGRGGFGHGRGGPFGGGDSFGDDGFRGGGRGGRGGGRRRLFDNETLRLILLKLIADEPRHGYDLIRAIDALSGEAYAPSPGVVYPTLTLLAEMDLIVEQPGEGSRKRFAITDAGQAQIAERKAALDQALERLASMAQHAERVDGAPVRRALHNLRIAVQHRLEKEGADSQTMFDVASMIDEAASKIERF